MTASIGQHGKNINIGFLGLTGKMTLAWKPFFPYNRCDS
jgi:hypothetical protein